MAMKYLLPTAGLLLIDWAVSSLTFTVIPSVSNRLFLLPQLKVCSQRCVT